jgi:peptidoglycan-N-acetylglucosamine deacetylase
MRVRFLVFILIMLCIACGMYYLGRRNGRQSVYASAQRIFNPEQAALRTAEREGDIIWRIHTHEKVVAITLDDGPDPRYTPAVLDIARKKGVHLTFFLIGKQIQKYSDIARREVEEGHVIGNHTWDHPNMLNGSEKHDLSEIERCENEIEHISGERTHLFRPPKGHFDGDTFLATESLGYRMILWSVALEHHEVKTPEQMVRRVMKQLTPGIIILMHDGAAPANRSRTVKALPLLIDALHKRGYRIVTVPQLLSYSRPNGRNKSL